MKISYAITVKDEITEFERLINYLLTYKKSEDEIVVLVDGETTNNPIVNLCEYYNVIYWCCKFKGNFAFHKNCLNKQCSGEWIFQIDADEIPCVELITNLHGILNVNASCDLFLVPRINTVEGLTKEWVDKWGWRVDENNYVNWPDYQTRIYKNKAEIHWEGNVHERIIGFKTMAYLTDDLFLTHNKTIEKQIKQNNLYDTIQQ